jgi:hypothetical protein
LLALLGSTWALGVLAALLTWNVAFVGPAPGLDPSWWAGLYVAAHRGMRFGTQVIFTYGPLGFLGLPWLWYGGLAVIAFLYQGVLHLALSLSLVWALRRTLNPVVALVVTCVVLITAPTMDVPVALAAVWCLAALSPSAPPFAGPVVVFGGALLGATETLIYLRSGPVILAMCTLTLLGGARRRRELPLFLAVAAVVFVALWFAAGQTAGNFPDFVANSLQVISGYSEAMAEAGSSSLYPVGALLLGVALVAAAAFTSRAGRPRVAATAVIALAAFSLFKEAAVRADPGHATVFFGTAAGVLAAIAFAKRRPLVIAALAGISVINVALDHRAALTVEYNPITHALRAGDQIRLLFNPRHRNAIGFFFLVKMSQRYALSPGTLALLTSHSVHVDPWEIGVIWAYRLNWDPLPVMQDYSAYTSTLDRLDADKLRSASGPQRILRENPALVDTQYRTPTIDNRFATWDPPKKSLAMLCNYVSLQTTNRWQVLAKVLNRCAAPRLIGSLEVRDGATVTIPPPPAGGIVYAKIEGAGVSGWERVRTFLYRARFRYIVVNGGASYRLVPGTTADGLLMNAARGVDFPRPFALSPAARTIGLRGVSGSVRIKLYAMEVRVR